MVGPITNLIPVIGPMRAEAAFKDAQDRRINEERSKTVSQPVAEGSAQQQSDEILTAEGEISKMAAGVLSTNGRLSIDQDDVTGDYIYRLVDKETGEVINQWPREEVLKQARIAREQFEGLIVDRSV